MATPQNVKYVSTTWTWKVLMGEASQPQGDMEIIKWLELFNLLELEIINGWSFSTSWSCKILMVGASQLPRH
jgi:hypothetical protein